MCSPRHRCNDHFLTIPARTDKALYSGPALSLVGRQTEIIVENQITILKDWFDH